MMCRIPIACCILAVLAAPALAETPLPAFNGTWTGSGTDRNMPLQSPQETKCRTRVTADEVRFASDTVCNGVNGLHKRWQLAVTFEGSAFKGEVTQSSSRKGSGDASVLKGAVTGQRNGDVAEFTARFPGLTPNAHVALALTSPNSFSMTVRALGSTLTDVSFRR
jgi:hypothetical protein